MKLKDACSLEDSYDQIRQHIKKQRHYFANKGPSGQIYGFSSSHVWMWELDYKESWALKYWCVWTVVSKKTLESPLDWKEIQPIHPKGNQSWYLLEQLMLKLKLQYFSHLMRRTDSLKKTLILGKTEGERRRGRQRIRYLDGIYLMWCDGDEFEWALGVGDGQGILACFIAWGHKESGLTEWLNWLIV